MSVVIPILPFLLSCQNSAMQTNSDEILLPKTIFFFDRFVRCEWCMKKCLCIWVNKRDNTIASIRMSLFQCRTRFSHSNFTLFCFFLFAFFHIIYTHHQHAVELLTVCIFDVSFHLHQSIVVLC